MMGLIYATCVIQIFWSQFSSQTPSSSEVYAITISQIWSLNYSIVHVLIFVIQNSSLGFYNNAYLLLFIIIFFIVFPIPIYFNCLGIHYDNTDDTLPPI